MSLHSYRQLFGTLANENCLKIITKLKDGEKNVTKIVEQTHLSQTCTSHCLARLSRDGFVTARRKGKFRMYTLNTPKIEQISTLLDRHEHKK